MTTIGLLWMAIATTGCGGGSSDSTSWMLEQLQVVTSDDVINVQSVAQISVIGRDNNCDIHAYTDRAAYRSSSPLAASVDQTGLVTGRLAGTANIFRRNR